MFCRVKVFKKFNIFKKNNSLKGGIIAFLGISLITVWNFEDNYYIFARITSFAIFGGNFQRKDRVLTG